MDVLRPRAKYVFKYHSVTRYLLMEHIGESIPRFPATWTQGELAGKQYIGFRETCDRRPGWRNCSVHGGMTLELEHSRMVTALKFSERQPDKAYGDYCGDAVMVEIPADKSSITLYFYADMKQSRAALFRQWLAGDLCTAVYRER
jgi:hypothetical protein